MSMKVTVFDVDHGFCAFLKTPTKHTLLIDCGCTDNFSPAIYLAENELSDAVPFQGEKLTKMIVTHPHDDHIEDIEALKQYCPPALLKRQNYDWGNVKSSQDADYENLNIYAEFQTEYNQTISHPPDYGMTILHFYLTPEEAKKADESKYINNSSIVTIATVKGTKYEEKFLFGGDMETAGWEALIAKSEEFRTAVKGVDFFVTSHHGHASGFSAALYQAMGRLPLVNIVSIHHNDENIAAEYSKPEYAMGVSEKANSGIALKGNGTRQMLTTRLDGTITVHVNNEGEFFISAAHLAENR